MTPTPMPMLALQIQEHLDDYVANTIGNMRFATTSKLVWLEICATADMTDMGGQFGWTWPDEQPDEHPPIIVAYCPEILAEMIAHLPAEDRAEYLVGVQCLWAAYITDMDQASDPDFRDRLVRELYEQAPYTGRLMEDVHARALALKIVPTEQGGAVTTDLPCTGCGYVNPKGSDECSLCETPL